MNNDKISWRYEVRETDRAIVRQMVAATDFFRPDEVDVAVELVDDRLAKHDASGYFFVIAEIDNEVAGFANYGPIACTLGSFDLYWIVVAPKFQRLGLGQLLLKECERLIQELAGRMIYIETSGKPQYAPTRSFYLRCGYKVVATFPDFYEVGDDKVVWSKRSGKSDEGDGE